MRSIVLRRRPSGCGSTNAGTYSALYCASTLVVGIAVVLWLSSHNGASVPTHRPHARRLRAEAAFTRWPFYFMRNNGGYFDRVSPGGERFATLYHSELAQHYDFMNTASISPDLISTIKRMESVGITTIMFSSPWNWFQPEESNLLYDRLDALANATCQNTKLKVSFVLDFARAPDWVFTMWPDAKTVDSHWKMYDLLSMFHVNATHRALQTLLDVVTHLTTTFPACVTAVQPLFNNQNEVGYSQENDCYQDYSTSAIAAFQRWLRDVRGVNLKGINRRWGTSFGNWTDVLPPLLEAGSFMGPDVTPRYWDFISFRELYGGELLNAACAAVQSAGALCFHHVSDLFTVLDAVYGTSIFKQIASSPHTDILIMTTNFRMPYGAAMSPTKMRLGVAAALSYNKTVYFEASLQHNPSLESLEAAVGLALAEGAQGVGISNWRATEALSPQLGSALQPRLAPCREEELVGVFISLDSCSAFHGLQRDYVIKDPIHELIESISEPLSERCGTAVSVFVELWQLPAALPSLNRLVFMEPLVLLGDNQLELYSQIKEAVRAMPHQLVQLPSSQTRGIQTAVMSDLA